MKIFRLKVVYVVQCTCTNVVHLYKCPTNVLHLYYIVLHFVLHLVQNVVQCSTKMVQMYYKCTTNVLHLYKCPTNSVHPVQACTSTSTKFVHCTTLYYICTTFVVHLYLYKNFYNVQLQCTTMYYNVLQILYLCSYIFFLFEFILLALY